MLGQFTSHKCHLFESNSLKTISKIQIERLQNLRAVAIIARMDKQQDGSASKELIVLQSLSTPHSYKTCSVASIFHMEKNEPTGSLVT